MRRQILKLLGLVLFLSPGLVAAEEDTPPCLAADPSREADLLHRRLDMLLFTNLRTWSPKKQNWVAADTVPMEDSARLYILHFWSDDCPPCVRELPTLNELSRRLARKHGRQVQIIYLSESQSIDGARRFFDANQKQIPIGPQYHDTGGVIRIALAADTGRSIPLPTTLIVDETRTIRHAIVGPVDSRDYELRSAVDRLMNRLH